MAIKGIVFDLYNTLVYISNRERPIVGLWKELNMNNADKRRAKREFMIRDLPDIAAMARHVQPSAMHDFSHLQGALEREVKSVKLYPETLVTLEKLKEKGYRLFLLSNLSPAYQSPVNFLGLEDYFEILFYSFEHGAMKPDRGLFRKVEEASELNPRELLMVGDSLHSDYKGARGAGWPALLIDPGYRHGNLPSIRNLKELLKHELLP